MRKCSTTPGAPPAKNGIRSRYLQELGVAYDTVQVAMDKMEHKAPEFVQSVNPFGKLPVITMANGKPLIESGAQLCYLAEVFDTNVKSPEDRAIVSQWCIFANAR